MNRLISEQAEPNDISQYKGTIEIMREIIKEYETVITKIRAEIKSLSNANPSYWHTADLVERDDVLEIIDKYMTGREVNNHGSKEKIL